MTPKIKNKDILLSHGCTSSREIVLKVTERVLGRLDSYHRIKSITSYDGRFLRIGTRCWDLSQKDKVYLIGAGKACNAMAMAIDEILGDRLTRGIAIVKISEPSDVFHRTEVYIGGHPLPNEKGLKACHKILELLEHATSKDLFLVVMSGGSSALMSCPVEGITLNDEILTTDIMLKSGANILEINAIRRHISALNGGMLAKKIQATGAELIGIGISDAVGSPATGDIGIPYANYRGTPMGPDQTTLEDTRNVILNYNVKDLLPARVVNHILNSGPEAETPKSFPDNTYYLINTLPDSCSYAKEIADEMGVSSMILTTSLEGEAREAGLILASIAKEIQTYQRPIAAPCLIFSSGEVTTKITDSNTIKGHGGPSQELTASFAIAAARIPGSCLLSIDSEGTDGTTPAAGAITDSSSYRAAVAKDINLYQALREHSCYEALSELSDVIYTGNTGTNLCDFNVLYVPGPHSC